VESVGVAVVAEETVKTTAMTSTPAAKAVKSTVKSSIGNQSWKAPKAETARSSTWMKRRNKLISRASPVHRPTTTRMTKEEIGVTTVKDAEEVVAAEAKASTGSPMASRTMARIKTREIITETKTISVIVGTLA
jgi:hypothetical protein